MKRFGEKKCFQERYALCELTVQGAVRQSNLQRSLFASKKEVRENIQDLHLIILIIFLEPEHQSS